MKTWIYLSNPFLNVTDDSYRTCKKIADFTLNALHANPADVFLNGLYLGLKPTVDTFNNRYTDWTAQMGAQKGKTSQLTINLKTLQSQKIENWDIKIQNVYAQGSPEYIALLPNRRVNFQTGSQEDRINAVKTLGQALTGIASLATVKTDVDAFYTTIKANFDIQKSNLTTTSSASDAVEIARVAVCIELYNVLAQLMSHFKSNPIQADAYFDMQSIRNHEQTFFKGTLHAGELKLAMTHTFIIAENVRLINKGNTALRFGLCPLATSEIDDTTFIDVPANDEMIVESSLLGDLANRFLKVKNLDSSQGAKYNIMLL